MPKVTTYEDFLHAVRTVYMLTKSTDFYLIGSQSLYGGFNVFPIDDYETKDFDIILIHNSDNASLLYVNGEFSHYDQMNGFYLDPVDVQNIVLPDGWEERCIEWVGNPAIDDDVLITVRCLSVNDLCAAKLYAGRNKDRLFVQSLLAQDCCNTDDIVELLHYMPIDDYKKQMCYDSLMMLVHNLFGGYVVDIMKDFEYSDLLLIERGERLNLAYEYTLSNDNFGYEDELSNERLDFLYYIDTIRDNIDSLRFDDYEQMQEIYDEAYDYITEHFDAYAWTLDDNAL